MLIHGAADKKEVGATPLGPSYKREAWTPRPAKRADVLVLIYAANWAGFVMLGNTAGLHQPAYARLRRRHIPLGCRAL